MAPSRQIRTFLFRAARAATRRLAEARDRRCDQAEATYAGEVPASGLNQICDPVSPEALMPHQHWISAIVSRYADHRFDLLGSGWIRVAYGVACAGLDGTRYPARPAITADPDGKWLDGRINAANLPTSQRIWRLVDHDYVPIDWQLDFRSGFRWREDCWFRDVRFGILPGVDVKVPWELGRMQHLVLLAWAHRLACTEAERTHWLREFRNQVLDFIATNPPRFGVNWYCAMDVAIRAANWIVAYSLFRAHEAYFDMDFERSLAQSLTDHGRHIVRHLEVLPTGRSNHYLADICGLLFISAALPHSTETDAWLAFAVQELADETLYQFNADGSNFEGSTFYHRLSGEIVGYATAVFLGLPAERRALLDCDAAVRLITRPHRRLRRPVRPPAPAHFERLERIAEFIADITKPNGRAVQIGDNDSGRFLNPHPMFFCEDGVPTEDRLDLRGTLAALATVIERDDLLADAGPDRLDSVLCRALSHGRQQGGTVSPHAARQIGLGSTGPLENLARKPGQTIELVVPGGGLRRRLQTSGYPDFGLWIYRSARIFLAIRCGPGSSERAGGSHAHNDQLAIELQVDGEDWIADPGSYLYCPPIEHRNAWRSVRAHAAPRWHDLEPGRLDVGNFRLEDRARARCIHFSELGFAGEHIGFPAPIRRVLEIFDDRIVVHDSGLPGPVTTVYCEGRKEVQRHFAISVTQAAGYGRLMAAVRAVAST